MASSRNDIGPEALEAAKNAWLACNVFDTLRAMSFRLPDNLVHVMLHCHRQWLPGDQRGFRSRRHRVHSSGDYKNPPPPDEHERLRYHAQKIMKGKPVMLSPQQRAAVGLALVYKLQKMGCEVLILSCGAAHVHIMMSPSEQNVDKQVGKAKQYASLKCPEHRGQLWGEQADIEAVGGIAHARRLFGYIRDHVEEGAWVWRFDRDAPPTKDDIQRLCKSKRATPRRG